MWFLPRSLPRVSGGGQPQPARNEKPSLSSLLKKGAAPFQRVRFARNHHRSRRGVNGSTSASSFKSSRARSPGLRGTTILITTN